MSARLVVLLLIVIFAWSSASGCAPVGGREYQRNLPAADQKSAGPINESVPPQPRRERTADRLDDSAGAVAARTFLADLAASPAENFEQIANEIDAGKHESWDEVFTLWAERNKLDREDAWKRNFQDPVFAASGGEGGQMDGATRKAVSQLARDAASGFRQRGPK